MDVKQAHVGALRPTAALATCRTPRSSVSPLALGASRPQAASVTAPALRRSCGLAAQRFRIPGPRPGAGRRRAGTALCAIKWTLEPVGDGDSSHLEEVVAKPGPITLDGDAFVVGRVRERSDIVIEVPTVSGSHARIERRGDEVYVTDLNSTNGTFLDEARLKPGAPTLVPNGSILTFGDQHLAQFKAVLTIEAVDV